MKIGVGLPVFNGVEFIELAIKSILNQTRLPDKVIIYDDGSTDNTLMFCRELMHKFDPQIKKIPIFRFVKVGINRGIGYSRHFLTEQIRQDRDYIAFISADDEWEPKFLETMEKSAKDNPNKIIFCETNMVDRDGESMLQSQERTFESQEQFVYDCWDAARKYKMFVNFSGVLMPSSVFEKIQFDVNERIGEDYKFLLESISLKKIQYNYVGLPLLRYRCHNKMTTVLKSKEIGANDERMMAEIKKQKLLLTNKTIEA